MVTSKSYWEVFDQASKKFVQVVSSNPFSQARVTANLPQPPCPHLLRSNTPPTESEISLIRDAITIAEEEELRLKEMASSHRLAVTSKTKTVRNLSRELGQFITEHNAILSSIRRICPEILQIIFIHTLPTKTTPGSRVLRASQLPWALSHVCQPWRTVMLSFAVMWTDLPIVGLTAKNKSFLDLLTELLKRSHNMPIRFTILRGSSADIAHPIIEMLVLHSDRWQEIKIHGTFSVLRALEKIKGHLSSLQSLHLYLPYFQDYDRPITDAVNYAVHNLFQIAPQLRHVGFYGLRLPDIIALHAGFRASNIYEPFFSSITPPALEELLFSSSTEDTLRPIRSMILRSGCSLKVLELKATFAPGELQSIFKLTPLVTKLTVTFPPTTDIFALMFDGNTPPLLPLLKECKFSRNEDQRQDSRVPRETLQALKLLASSRCELPDNIGSAEMLLSSGFHLLQTLRISLHFQSIPHRQYFEGWVNSDMTNELYKLHGRLLVMLPELLQRNIPSTRKFDLTWKRKVTGLLTHLETLKIEKASDICIPGLQYILYVISIGFNQGDVRFSFSLIARRILEKWEPILRDDMPNLHWLSTAFSLEYLPTMQSHGLCSSPDAMKLFFYRLETYDISDDYYVKLYGKLAHHMVAH